MAAQSFRDMIINRLDDAAVMYSKVEAVSGKQVKVFATSSRGAIANAVGGHDVEDKGTYFLVTKSS